MSAPKKASYWNVGNVSVIGRRRAWTEEMTYTELNVERRWCQAVLEKLCDVRRRLRRRDERGIYQQLMDADDHLTEVIKDLRKGVCSIEAELLKRIKEGR